jgi:hypothetical protein
MKMSKYLQQGKSENYQDAEDKQLLKAGEVAARLTKKFKTKISAKELEKFSKEWHHAGVFKTASGALKGKRVYFFKEEDIKNITLEQILSKRIDDTQVQGWYVQYFKMTDPQTRRTISKPFIGIYKGPKSKSPKGLKELSNTAFANAEKQKGKDYKPEQKYDFGE